MGFFDSVKKEIGGVTKSVLRETGGSVKSVLKEAGDVSKSVVAESYKATKQVVEDTGLDGAVKKGAKTFNKVGGATVDNFIKLQDALTSGLTFFADPKFLGLQLVLFLGIFIDHK